MEELGIRPTMSIVTMVDHVFKKLDMLDKYEKLNRKYPPPKWEYRYIKGKRVKVRTKSSDQSEDKSEENNFEIEASSDALDLNQNAEASIADGEDNLYLPESTYSPRTDW